MLNTYNIKIQYNAWTIPLLRTHNIYIMEAISKMGLTIIQLKQSNACRMYLQITMTQAEILDHMGCFLLTQALLQCTQTEPLGLESLSTSTLEWPAINNPTKATWKLWIMTICTLFTGNTQGTKLRAPLGPWTTDYQTYHNWKWRMTPDQQLLHQRSATASTRVAILVKTHQCYLTFSIPIPTNQDFHGTPVTPHDTHHRDVRTPLSVPPTKIATVNTVATHSLIEQFREPLQSWQWPLYGPIRWHQKTMYLNDLCAQHHPITLVSDASVQKNKQSGFAWIITHGDRHLWAGVGLAPGNTEDMYSRRAEAFGVLAGLLFFWYFMACFPPNNYRGAQLQCHCDNQGILTNVMEMRTQTTQWPNDTTSDDYNIYAAICQVTSQCQPVRISFQHVKGHQDKDLHQPLTIVKQLNVECDKQAKSYTKSETNSSTAYGKPLLPTAQPHLLIGKKNIWRNVLPALWHATSVPPIVPKCKRNTTGLKATSTKSTGKSLTPH